MRATLCAIWLVALAGAARAAPDVERAAQALLATPFRVAGDLAGAGGLCGASVIGLTGDALGLIDGNPVTRPVLRELASGAVRRIALGLSQGSTGLLEGLRAEDVERLPEPRAAYLDNAPGLGRLDTLQTGLGALRLALEDALGGPARALLHGVGANAAAEAVLGFQADERTRVLGPLAPPEEDGSSTLAP